MQFIRPHRWISWPLFSGVMEPLGPWPGTRMTSRDDLSGWPVPANLFLPVTGRCHLFLLFLIHFPSFNYCQGFSVHFFMNSSAFTSPSVEIIWFSVAFENLIVFFFNFLAFLFRLPWLLSPVQPHLMSLTWCPSPAPLLSRPLLPPLNQADLVVGLWVCLSCFSSAHTFFKIDSSSPGLKTSEIVNHEALQAAPTHLSLYLTEIPVYFSSYF